MDVDSLSHTRWKCEYHIVWIPKYRRMLISRLFNTRNFRGFDSIIFKARMSVLFKLTL